jgi:hypothetical protein
MFFRMLKDLDFVGYRYVCLFMLPRFSTRESGANQSSPVPGGFDVLCHLCDIPSTINNFDPKNWSS